MRLTQNETRPIYHVFMTWLAFWRCKLHIQEQINAIDPHTSNADDTRGRKPASISGVENRNRLSERVSCKNDSDFRLRKSAPVFDPCVFSLRQFCAFGNIGHRKSCDRWNESSESCTLSPFHIHVWFHGSISYPSWCGYWSKIARFYAVPVSEKYSVIVERPGRKKVCRQCFVVLWNSN